MKKAAALLLLICGLARAEGPMIGLEYESEKEKGSDIRNEAVDVIPGWEFSEQAPITRVELMLERNQDTGPDDEGIRTKENRVFLRLRKDGEFSERLEWYVRGGVGRAFNSQHAFNYGYIEPAIEFKFAPKWGWTLAYRDTNAIDSTKGEHVRKVITGPSIDFDEHNELELRYAKGNGDEHLTAWAVEYVHRF